MAIQTAATAINDFTDVNIVDLDRARNLQQQADQFFQQSHFQESIGPYLSALDIFQRMGFSSEVAVIRHQLGFAYLALGDNNSALAQFESNLQYHRSRDDSASISNYLQYSAQIYSEKDEHTKAQRYLDEARDLAINQPARLAEIEHWRVTAAERANDLTRAREIVEVARAHLGETEWSQYLQADAIRLGLNAAKPFPLSNDRKAVYLLLVFAACVIVIAFVKITRRPDWLLNAALILMGTAVAVLIMEGVLRLVVPPSLGVTHFVHAPNRVTRFAPDAKLMPGVNYNKTFFTVNEAGIRADPLPVDRRPRILVIGGSSTEGLFLDDRDAWPYQLQLQLNAKRADPVWVGNAGKSGLNSFSHLVQVYFLRSELHPQLMLIQAGINDLNQCISGGLSAIRDNSRLAQSADFPMVYRQYVFDRIQPPNSQAGLRVWAILEKFFIRDTAQEKARGMDYVIQDQAGQFYAEQRLRRQRAIINDAEPEISECLAAFEYNLRRIVTLTKEYNISLMFLTQGSLYRADVSKEEEALLWFGSVDANPFSSDASRVYHSARVMGALLDKYNRVTLSLCKEFSLLCVDIATLVTHSVDNYYDDVHLTIAGATRVAAVTSSVVEGWLRERQ